MSYISANLSFLLNAVKKAGTALSRDFNEIELLQSSVRGHREFTAAAVERLRKALKIELQKGRPDYAVVFDGDARPAAPHFLVAPLDGALNFMHGIAHFALSVAMVENNQIGTAVIYNPANGETFFAEKGKGAFKEGFRSHERLRVSARKDLAEAVAGVGDCSEKYAAFAALRMSGSVSLDMAWVASGKLDAAIAHKQQTAAYAAGLLLIKEAGGYIYELNQKDIRSENLPEVFATGSFIAVNGELGRKVYELINK